MSKPTSNNPLLRPGSCCAQLPTQPSGLLHVLLHAPSDIDEFRFGRTTNWDVFYIAAVCHRRKYYPWMHLSQSRPKQHIWDWIERTPTVSDWVLSDESFRAPRDWTESTLAAFGQTPIPEPVDFANIDWGKHKHLLADHNVAVLQAYTFGVDIPMLKQMLQTSESQVHAQLAQGVRTLLEYPTFRIWCTPLDWKHMVIPEGLGQDTFDQTIMASALRKNPFAAPAWAAEVVVNTLAYGAYARSDVPKNLLRERELRTPPFLVAPP